MMHILPEKKLKEEDQFLLHSLRLLHEEARIRPKKAVAAGIQLTLDLLLDEIYEKPITEHELDDML